MSTSATFDHDQPMLAIGHQCSHSTCNLVDFLPFKCQHCSEQFCGDHFLPQQHSCPKFDEFAHNRVAPDCPLCNEPVSIPPGEDPNVRMERHFNQECSVMTGKAKSKTPRCARGKCDKVLYSPIKCEKCKLEFCAIHRFPATHNCSSIASSSKPALSKPTARSNLPNPTLMAAQIRQSSKDAIETAKESMAAAKASTTSVAKATTLPGFFNKTERLPLTTSSMTAVIPAIHTRSTQSLSPTVNSNDPPATCIPKQPHVRPSFAPPPLFVSA